MLTRLGRFIVRRRRAILVGRGALRGRLASRSPAGVASRLTSGGFADPSSESERAAHILQRQFGAKDPNVVLLVTAKHGDRSTTPRCAAAGRRLTRELARQPELGQVASYWSLGDAPPLKSKDGHAGARARRHRGQRRPRRRRGRRSCRRSSRATTRRCGVAVGGRAEVVPPGRRHRSSRTSSGRGHRVPDHAGPAGARLRQPRRRRAAARSSAWSRSPARSSRCS